ncbi:MAG: hypothetical protein V2I43_16425 [Parvularcula sp.]|jgi:Ca2+-binding EF-hand superfamily protein|nr:hypothetical protein [Parvularcula sp.]
MLNLLFLAALPLVAAQPGGGPSGTMSGGDGEPITKAEVLESAAERFGGLDLDENGELTFDEIGEAREQRRMERRQNRFDHVDANDDGVITENEILAQAEARFDAMDTDGDGVLTAEERRASKKAKGKKLRRD